MLARNEFLTLQACPFGQFAAAEERFRGPGAEIGRQGHAVACVSAEDDGIAACGMPIQNGWQPAFAEKDWTAPAMRELHLAKRRMQSAHSLFHGGEEAL